MAKSGESMVEGGSVLHRRIEPGNELCQAAPASRGCNPCLDRLESETRQDLVSCAPWERTDQTLFQQAGRTRSPRIKTGWFLVRLPDTQLELWVLVAEDHLLKHTLILLSNVPIDGEAQAK